MEMPETYRELKDRLIKEEAKSLHLCQRLANKAHERERGAIEGILIGVVFSLLVAAVIAVSVYGDWIDG